MLRKVFGYSFVAAAMALVPMFAKADFQAGNWELELGGAGTSNHQFTSGAFSVNGSLGYFLNKNLEAGVRQSVTYADAQNTGSAWTGTTSLFAEYNFDMGNWVPFLGGNVGFTYGDKTVLKNYWSAGPEGGVKYFLNSTTFIYGTVGYEFLFAENKAGSSGFIYGLGLGVALK